jgi:hypothetical protein
MYLIEIMDPAPGVWSTMLLAAKRDASISLLFTQQLLVANVAGCQVWR